MNSRHLLLIALSAIGAAAMVLFPELLPAIAGRPDRVWTLFNSANYRAGDMYYYASMLQQVLWGHIPPRPPNALANSASPENFRWVSYAIAALPGLLTSDTRIVHLFTLALPSALSMAVGMGLSLYFTRRPWPAFMAALVATFFLQAWCALTVYPSGPRPGALLAWAPQMASSLEASLQLITHIYELDQYEMLRFAVPSISYVLLACFAFVLVLLDRRRSWPLAVVATAFAILLAFSYPPHTLAAYLLLIAFAAVNLFDRDWAGLRIFVAVGVTTIAALLVAGVPQILVRGFGEATFISSVYGLQSLTLQAASPGAAITHLVLNKYTLSFVAALYASRDVPALRRAVVAIGGVVLVFSCSLLLEPSIYSRFLERGIDHLWLLLISIVFWNALARRTEFLERIPRHALRAALAGVLLLTAAAGFCNLLAVNRQDGRHFIAAGQWAAYDWLARHASGETIAALNWDDIEFIAVYHGNLKCVFGPADLANLKPELGMVSYVSTWKDLGLKRAQLEHWVRRSAAAESGRLEAVREHRPTPYLDADDFAASRIVSALVYYPYIDRFGGGPVATAGPKGWQTAPAFIDNVLEMFDEAPAKGYLSGAGVKYLLMSNDERQLLDEDRLRDYEIVFQSGDRTVLRRR